jgi:hypothetical protein
MNDETMPSFPPFVPAKPKGGVAAEIEASKHGDPPRTRKAPKSATEIVNDALTAPRKRKKRKPRATTIPLDALPAFAGLAPAEVEQVVVFCEALQTFSKLARLKIVLALGKIFV